MAAFEVFPPLGDLLQLSDFPLTEEMDQTLHSQLPAILQNLDFNLFLILLMVIDTATVYLLERQIRLYYNGPAKIKSGMSKKRN